MNPSTNTAGLQGPKPTTEEKVPYDSGYRDFVFGHRLDRLKYEHYVKVYKYQYNSQVAEVQSSLKSQFRPDAAFNLFGLPLEVRFRIYDIFLGPVKQYCEKTKSEYIEMRFEIPHRGGSLYFSSRRPHPGRRSDYRLNLIRDGNNETNEDAETWSVIQQIRDISNSSCKLRKEFGREFWKNVHLECQTLEQIAVLPSFLEIRPATHTGIRTLSLQISFDFSGFKPVLEEGQPANLLSLWEARLRLEDQPLVQKCAETLNFCTAMDDASKSLCLESLFLTLDIPARLFEHLGSCKKGDWLDKVRSLNVSKSFDLKIEEMDDYGSNHSFHDLSPGHHFTSAGNWKQLEEKWSPVIRNLMMPDTLRRDPESWPLNEVQQYMKSRLL